MIIDILDLLVDLALDDTVHLRTLALFAWPRLRSVVGGWLKLAGSLAIEQLDDLDWRRRQALADRQLLAQLRRCA